MAARGKLDKVKLDDGRVVTVARHKVGVMELAYLLINADSEAAHGMAWGEDFDPQRWPDIVFLPTTGSGHLLTYDGFATRVGLVDEDLRHVVIMTGNNAEATEESSRTFGNVLEAALAEQARRRAEHAE